MFYPVVVSAETVDLYSSSWDKGVVVVLYGKPIKLPTGEIVVKGPFDIVIVLEEILGDIINALFKSRLLIQIDYIGAES